MYHACVSGKSLLRVHGKRAIPSSTVNCLSDRSIIPPAISIFILIAAGARHTSGADFPLDERPQPWERQAQPIFSARTTTEKWCKVVLYSPHVIRANGKYHMWYVGTSTGSRVYDMGIGYAESNDGLNWTPHPKNPVLTGADLPYGPCFQTPFVMFDQEENRFKLWFTAVLGSATNQAMGYATSPDGIQWKVHPKPIYPSIRSPMVEKIGPAKYRMWANSDPGPGKGSLFNNIFEFSSTDGLKWDRRKNSSIRPSEIISTCVYPFVSKIDGHYYMWYGGHIDGGMFELFCATSGDGSDWRTDHKRAAFPAAEGKERFDSRYTSTPSVVVEKDRILLYYSARDWNRDYIDSQGRKKRDGSSPYSHIGVAVMKRKH